LKENCRVIVSSLADAHEEGELLMLWLQAPADSRCLGRVLAAIQQPGSPRTRKAARQSGYSEVQRSCLSTALLKRPVRHSSGPSRNNVRTSSC